MSRSPINEEILGQLRRGMDSLTILDPGRLRIPFNKPSNTKKSWMAVSGSIEIPETIFDIEIPVVPSDYYEVPGWLLAMGYSIFGLGLGLCNLLVPQHASKVCTAVSPIPLLCLLLQAFSKKKWGLVIAAPFLPSACWNLYLAVPLVLAVSVLVFEKRGFAWVCLSGVCIGLLLIPTLEPRWGMTVAIFFTCILCFLAGLGYRVGITVKLL